MFGAKSCLALILSIILGLWITKQNGPKREYLETLSKFEEIKIELVNPEPIDQSILYKSAQEIIDPVIGEKSGKIPEWLTGSLLRNGPGLFEFEHQKAEHAFDGMAMIRRYDLQYQKTEKNVSVMNFSRRLIDSDFLRANVAEQKFTNYGIGTAPLHTSILDRLNRLKGQGADNVVVSTIPLFGHYYAATELPQIIEYDPITLETLSKVDLGPIIPGINANLKYLVLLEC